MVFFPFGSSTEGRAGEGKIKQPNDMTKEHKRVANVSIALFHLQLSKSIFPFVRLPRAQSKELEKKKKILAKRERHVVQGGVAKKTKKKRRKKILQLTRYK